VVIKSKWIFLVVLLLIVPVTFASWQIESIETVGVDAGRFATLKIDSYDMPHIAYMLENPDKLKYAHYQAVTWQFEYPTGSSGMGLFLDMVLDRLDSAHITHHDPQNDNLMWTWRSGMSNLTTEILDDEGVCGFYTAVDLTNQGKLGVAYFNATDSTLLLKLQKTGSWSNFVVANGLDINCIDLKIDEQDKLHVIYSDTTNNMLRYAVVDDVSFVAKVIDYDVFAGACELCLDSTDVPYCLYMDSLTADLKYAYLDNYDWTVETAITEASAASNSVSFVIDSNDVKHGCYYNMDQHLIYTKLEGTTWQQELVDDDGDVGHYCSMDADSQNLIHIAYYDRARKDLRYARQLPPPTPTPTPSAISIDLIMNDTYMTENETFLLERSWKNTMGSSVSVDEYILLEILGMYWYWPGWQDSVDYSQWSVPVGGPTTETVPALTLTSTAFTNGQSIPEKHTCDGADISPELTWNSPTQIIKSYALIMDDPDAPGGDWVHWVIYNIPPETTSLMEHMPFNPNLPDGSMQGLNDWGNYGYRGPCPPSGLHRYFFKLYALDSTLNLISGKTKAELLEAMNGHVLYQTELMGTFSR